MPQFLEFTLAWSLHAIWFWALLVIGLVWLRRHLHINAAHDEPILSAADANAPGAPLPRLSVLVAAKDEEANIGTCLAGLLKQDYPDFEVIAANDRSSDRTAEIIDRIAARDPRVTPVHIRHLPEGWGGKNHAMHNAVARAAGEYFCFTDADCRYHDPALLRAAMRFAQRAGVDLLSVLPRLDADTFWERVVQPPAGAVMVYWFPPGAVNNPKSPTAYANGAFMLMSRDAYGRIGGHSEARSQLNEDMHFAQRAKAEGLVLKVIRGGGMYSVRMYSGLKQIWNGWTRIFYCCFGTLPKLIVSVLFLGVFSVLPTVSLLLSPLAGPSAAGIALASSFAVLLQQTVLWRFYRISDTPPVWAVTYPLGAGLCLLITLNATARYAGVRTKWRGTTYSGGKLGGNPVVPVRPPNPT
jgi:cellulose synthase/poly-beta-1,6-N-acetylglucosamine synthase-like glycosyltransferase